MNITDIKKPHTISIIKLPTQKETEGKIKAKLRAEIAASLKAQAEEKARIQRAVKRIRSISVIQPVSYNDTEKSIIKRVKEKFAPPFDSIITVGQGKDNVYLNIADENIRKLILQKLRQTMICRFDPIHWVMVIISPELMAKQIAGMIESILKEELLCSSS